jgi:hypothetical protein
MVSASWPTIGSTVVTPPGNLLSPARPIRRSLDSSLSHGLYFGKRGLWRLPADHLRLLQNIELTGVNCCES